MQTVLSTTKILVSWVFFCLRFDNVYHARAASSTIRCFIFSFCSAAKDATPLIFQRILNEGQSHLRIGSVKYSDRSWFIVITAEDKIRAAAPSSGNEILEELNVADGIIALRVVNYSDIVNAMPNHGSGSSLESDDSNLLLPDIDMNSSDRECYIGFSSENGRAQCYDNPNNINVRMNIIPVAAWHDLY